MNEYTDLGFTHETRSFGATARTVETKMACRDCAKAIFSPPPAYYRCADERVAVFDPVHGNQAPDCRGVREDSVLCGPGGQWFASKECPSLFAFLREIFAGRPS